MKFRIQPHSNQPIYDQIIEQVRLGVATGELGRNERLPTVRGLAAELGVHANTVARAYSEMERDGLVTTRSGLGTYVAVAADDLRVTAERDARLAGLLGKALLQAISLGYTLDEIEASFVLRLARWRKEPDTHSEDQALPNDTIIVMGSHDLVLDVLAEHVSRRSSTARMVSTNVGSLGGLMALSRGECHLAGCHLLDEATGRYNMPYIERMLPRRRLVVVNLVHRVQGLMVARGNPRQIHGIADLARQDVTLVNRQWGSGTRVLLDHLLAAAGIPAAAVRGYEREEQTHLAVAGAVAGGSADVGLGILSAARALELGFVSLTQEQYDLVIPRDHYESELLRPVREVIESDSFRKVVERMGGYDMSSTGRIISET